MIVHCAAGAHEMGGSTLHNDSAGGTIEKGGSTLR